LLKFLANIEIGPQLSQVRESTGWVLRYMVRMCFLSLSFLYAFFPTPTPRLCCYCVWMFSLHKTIWNEQLLPFKPGWPLIIFIHSFYVLNVTLVGELVQFSKETLWKPAYSIFLYPLEPRWLVSHIFHGC
jgi:hypothetical protein